MSLSKNEETDPTYAGLRNAHPGETCSFTGLAEFTDSLMGNVSTTVAAGELAVVGVCSLAVSISRMLNAVVADDHHYIKLFVKGHM